MKKRFQYLWLFGFAAGLAGVGLYLQRLNRQFLRSSMRTRGLPSGEGRLILGKQIQAISVLESSRERLWQLAITSGLMTYLDWPWISFHPTEEKNLPAIWRQGDSVQVKLRFLFIIPLGKHTIVIEKVDSDHYSLQTRKHGRFAQVWDHAIDLQELPDGWTIYTDTIDIYAGPQTDRIASLAAWLFRYRQARLRALVRSINRQSGA